MNNGVDLTDNICKTWQA